MKECGTKHQTPSDFLMLMHCFGSNMKCLGAAFSGGARMVHVMDIT